MTDANDPAVSAQSLEEDLTIPRAAVNKFIKEICPNIRVGFETRELLLQSCTEFIHLISSEANQICNESQKKTITAEHILRCKYQSASEVITQLYILVGLLSFNSALYISWPLKF